MEVLNVARDMAAHILKMASQETLVPRRHRWFLGTRLVDNAVSIYQLCVMANNTYVDSHEAAVRRINYYKFAYERSAGLLALLQVCELSVESLRGHRFFVIVEKVCDTQAKIAMTIRNEKERFLK